LESFCPRFTPGGLVLYVGDAGNKFIINETQKFREIGIELDPHGKMPQGKRISNAIDKRVESFHQFGLNKQPKS
jgi:hypothetical protein